MSRKKEYNLKGLTNYKSAFSLLQIVIVVVIVALVSLMGFIYYSSQKTIKSLQNSIYIMDKSGAVAVGNRVGETPAARLFEYRDQVKVFFHLWYELDASSFDENINSALNLVGKCGKILYSQYLDADLKKNLIVNGIYTKAIVDSIKFNTKEMPIRGIVYGRQKIIRKNSTIIRQLICTFSIHDINRSEINSHGALLDDWKIINNEIIKDE